MSGPQHTMREKSKRIAVAQVPVGCRLAYSGVDKTVKSHNPNVAKMAAVDSIEELAQLIGPYSA